MSVRISSIVPASSTDDDDDGDSVNGNLLNVIHFPFGLRSILFLLRNQLLSLSLSSDYDAWGEKRFPHQTHTGLPPRVGATLKGHLRLVMVGGWWMLHKAD